MLTAEGVQALLKVKEQKLAHPETLTMNSYTESSYQCGTVSCIGGQLVLNQPEYAGGCLEAVEKAVYAKSLFKVEAAKILGFDIEEREDDRRVVESLFHISDWPEQLKQKWNCRSCQAAESAQIVAERIDLFIAEHYKPEEEVENG